MKNKLTIFILAFVCFTFSCRNKTGIVTEFCPIEFTPQQQRLVGDKISEVLHTNTTLFPILEKEDFPEAYEYLTKLMGTAILTPYVLNRNLFDWELHIIHNDNIKTAFFLPNGEFFIYTGLLKFLKSENQLLTVISHELYYTNSDIIPLSIYDGVEECNVLGDILLDQDKTEDIEIFAERMPDLTFEPNQVAQADSFTIELLCDFRYDPLGIQEIVQMAENQGDMILWLTTRPMESLEERVEYNVALAADCMLGGVRNEESYLNFVENHLP